MLGSWGLGFRLGFSDVPNAWERERECVCVCLDMLDDGESNEKP